MATYEPTIQVEAAFGFGALDASPSWTTISVVQSGSIRRGRAKELDQFSSGQVSLRLVDEDRVYDPLNTAGSYAGSLLPNVPLRVVATHGGTDYPRFYGYVDKWEVDPRHNTGFVSVSATDGFKILAREKLPTSVYESVVLADTPWLYWDCGNTDRIAVDRSGNDRDGLYHPYNAIQGESPIVPYSTNGAVKTRVNGDPPIRLQGSEIIAAPPCTVEMTIKADVDSVDPGGYFLFMQTSATSTEHFWVEYVLDAIALIPTVRVRHTGRTPGTGVDFPLPTRPDDGQPHHLLVTVDATTLTVYWDGESVAAGSSAGATFTLSEGIVALGFPAVGWPPSSWLGSISDAAYYNTALSASDAAAHYAAWSAPWDGDVTGARIGRILDLIGWPAALRDVDDGEVVLGPADLAGMNALAYIQLVAQSEGGRLFMGADGSVVFHGAARLRANTTASVTFSDDGSDTPYLYGSAKYTLDDRDIYNQASIQRKYGTPQTAEDATSIAVHGPRTRTLTGLLMQTDAQSRNRAESDVFRYKNPQVRFDAWTVNPEVKPATWPDNLGLEIGDHIAFEIQTAGTLSRVTTQLDLEQIGETFTPSKYELSHLGSSRDPNVLNYLTFGGTLATQSFGTGVFA